jgi:hypothetical protein
MQYYSDPQNIPIENIITNVNLILDSIDKLSDARIIGGEPFLNKDIDKLINILNLSDKVDHITIYSNATFVPSIKILESMSNINKLHVEFTDYEILSKSLLKIPQVFDSYNIKYFVHKPQNWTDSARIVENNFDENQLTQMFKACCVNDALTLLNNQLYHCPYSANLYNLKEIPDDSTDKIYISNDINSNELRNQIKNFYYNKPYLSACKYCAGRDFTQELVKPALQVKKYIPIHTRKEWQYVEHNNTN